MNTPTEIECLILWRQLCERLSGVAAGTMFFTALSELCVLDLHQKRLVNCITLSELSLWFISLPLCTPLCSHTCIFSSVHPVLLLWLPITCYHLLTICKYLLYVKTWENKIGRTKQKTVFPKNYSIGSSEFSHVTKVRYLCKKSLAYIFCWYNVSILVMKALSVIKIPSDIKEGFCFPGNASSLLC